MACFLFYSVEVVRVVPQEQMADKIFEKRRISSVDIPLYLNMSFSVTFYLKHKNLISCPILLEVAIKLKVQTNRSLAFALALSLHSFIFDYDHGLSSYE